jgi:Domain of unknown function (DUF4832)/Domain of unknown function (DUF4874)
MKFLFLIVLPLFVTAINVNAQDNNVNYKESKEDFPNPERGFYIPVGTTASHFKPLETAALKRMFAGPQKHGKATYAIYSTLLMREYTLDNFRDQPLSQEFLDHVDQDLTVVREAGLKVILRFAYTSTAKTGTCPDQYKICPPYGDAPKAIVLEHIKQLAPLFKKHDAIIAVLQEGFIGIWGESFYTDYFGDPGGNGPGRMFDSSWRDRGEVLHALLAALPQDRMVQVRTPQIKQKFVYGPEAPVEAKPLSPTDAFTGTEAARIGFHNDCFLSGPDDYGTYYDYGSTNTPQKPANAVLRKYVEDDSRYLPLGGETCDDTYSPQNDCSPTGHAEQEMAGMHYSFLNTTYNNDVNNDWDSLGCISSIRQRLGYRFVLTETHMPARAASGQPLSFTIHLLNAGYASPYNPRAVLLILRNRTTGTEYPLSCQADPRKWYSGKIVWNETLQLSSDLPGGTYDLFLALSDEDPSLAKRPEYSIRLANEETWEPATGYNNLHCSITVSHK